MSLKRSRSKSSTPTSARDRSRSRTRVESFEQQRAVGEPGQAVVGRLVQKSSSSCLRSVMSSSVPDTPGGPDRSRLREAHVDPAHCAVGTDDAVCVLDIGLALHCSTELASTASSRSSGWMRVGEDLEAERFGSAPTPRIAFSSAEHVMVPRRSPARSCRGAPSAGHRRGGGDRSPRSARVACAR